MNRDALFAGLPAEFAPPEKAADRIVELKTAAEREAYWLRLPELWRAPNGMIAVFARTFLASAIADGELSLEQRRAAIAEVPVMWRDEVVALVKALWETRHIRAEHRAEQEAARERRRKETA